MFIWGKGLRQICFKSSPTTGPKFYVLGAAASGPFSLLNCWRRGSLSLRDLHFSPKFKDSSFNNSNVFIFNLNQQDGLVYVGPTTWISAARHPAVNHLEKKSSKRKCEFHRNSCHFKVVADNSGPLQGKGSRNTRATLT